MNMDFSARGIYGLNRKRGQLWKIHKKKKESVETVNISTKITRAKQRVNAAGTRQTQVQPKW
jgi:hypothetical protein